MASKTAVGALEGPDATARGNSRPLRARCGLSFRLSRAGGGSAQHEGAVPARYRPFVFCLEPVAGPQKTWTCQLPIAERLVKFHVYLLQRPDVGTR